ncbi:hypothetical protein TURU_010588 [Turdus rufiventris]|nr:hypothetical protein TURU_010588 [Turdus rufiventris]
MEKGRAASQSQLLEEQGRKAAPSQLGGKVQGRTPLTVGVLVLSVVLRSRKTLAVGVQGPDPTTEKTTSLPEFGPANSQCPPTRQRTKQHSTFRNRAIGASPAILLS